MKKLYVTRGLPGSGKSTWAKKKAAEEPNTVIVNRDKIREMLKGEYQNFPFGTSMEKIVTKIENYSIIKSIENYDVIVDSTRFRFNPDTLKKHPTLGHKINFIVEEVDFTHVDIETCIQRDQQRKFPVGKEVIERMYNKYLKNVED